MIKQAQRDLYLKAIEVWGIDAQVNMAIEEMGELLQAFMKLKRSSSDSKTLLNVQDEIADVLITIEQAAIIFGEQQVDERKRIKLDRLGERLDKY
jgi:NTP pyrophosphatase (non-canonical NTP hydrolase)